MSTTQQTLLSDDAVEQLNPRIKRLKNVDVITTVNGGSDTSYAAARSGVMIGIRSNYTRPPDDVTIDFVDWPFEPVMSGKLDWQEAYDNHVEVVRRERPKYAVAPDVDEHTSFGRVLLAAAELQQYAEIVIVVPKKIHPTRVPRQYRVGMPCQDRFGGTPHSWSEYSKCHEVHVLGGDPTKQMKTEQYYVPVKSVDTAVPISRARWGDVWRDEKFIRQDLGFYGSIERSFSNIWTEWNGVDVAFGRRERLKYPTPQSNNPEYNEDPFEVVDYLMPKDDVPFPGRAWCYENSVTDWRGMNENI